MKRELDKSAWLTDYQKAHLQLWSRTQMVEFLYRIGERSPRRALRQKPTEWLMQECIVEGALQCNQCLNQTTVANPLLDSGLCKECEEKAQTEEAR